MYMLPYVPKIPPTIYMYMYHNYIAIYIPYVHINDPLKLNSSIGLEKIVAWKNVDIINYKVYCKFEA